MLVQLIENNNSNDALKVPSKSVNRYKEMTMREGLGSIVGRFKINKKKIM